MPFYYGVIILTACLFLRDSRQPFGQCDVGRHIIGRSEPLFIGCQAGHIEHLEQQLARTERVAGVFPGEFEHGKPIVSLALMTIQGRYNTALAQMPGVENM